MVNVLKFVDVTIIICQFVYVRYHSNNFYYGDKLLDYQNYYLQKILKDMNIITDLENMYDN